MSVVTHGFKIGKQKYVAKNRIYFFLSLLIEMTHFTPTNSLHLNTPTHILGFYVLWGGSIDMIFLFPNAKPTLHKKHL